MQSFRKDVGLLGLALQNKSSNYLVLMLHRQLRNYLLVTRESHHLTAQHFYMA